MVTQRHLLVILLDRLYMNIYLKEINIFKNNFRVDEFLRIEGSLENPWKKNFCRIF